MAYLEIFDPGFLSVIDVADGGIDTLVLASRPGRRLTRLSLAGGGLAVAGSRTTPSRPIALVSNTSYLFALCVDELGVGPTLMVYDNDSAMAVVKALVLESAGSLAVSDDGEYLLVGYQGGEVEVRSADDLLTVISTCQTGISRPRFAVFARRADLERGDELSRTVVDRVWRGVIYDEQKPGAAILEHREQFYAVGTVTPDPIIALRVLGFFDAENASGITQVTGRALKFPTVAPFPIAAIMPTFDGYTELDDGTYDLWFGYDYPGELVAAVRIGANNTMTSSDQYQGQPEIFYPGANRRVFAVRAASPGVGWTVLGETVVSSLSEAVDSAHETRVMLSVTRRAQHQVYDMDVLRDRTVYDDSSVLRTVDSFGPLRDEGTLYPNRDAVVDDIGSAHPAPRTRTIRVPEGWIEINGQTARVSRISRPELVLEASAPATAPFSLLASGNATASGDEILTDTTPLPIEVYVPPSAGELDATLPDGSSHTFPVGVTNLDLDLPAGDSTFDCGSFTLTITRVVWSMDDVAPTAGDPAEFHVVRTDDGQTLPISYMTADGTAEEPADYTATTGTASLAGTDDEQIDVLTDAGAGGKNFTLTAGIFA